MFSAVVFSVYSNTKYGKKIYQTDNFLIKFQNATVIFIYNKKCLRRTDDKFISE